MGDGCQSLHIPSFILLSFFFQNETGFDGKIIKQGFLLKKVRT